MKKLVFIATLGGIALIGCSGGSSDNDSAVVSPQKNILSIQGDNINQKTTIDQIADNVKISATGNQPIDFISWYSVGNKNERFKFGQIFLEKGKESAKLFLLADAIEINNSVNGFLLSSSYCNSVECSKYLMTEGKEELNLQIKFKNIQSVYQDASTIGINATSKSKVIIAREKDGIIIHPELPVQPEVNTKIVTVTGDLNFKIPSSWPIAQKSRFPIIQTQGQLVFDGKAYKISSLNYPEIVEYDNKIYNTHYEITLKNNLETILLSINTNEGAIYPFNQATVTIIKNDEYYSTQVPIPQKFWIENPQSITINIPEVILIDDITSMTRLLGSNLIIPKTIATLELNTQPIKLYKDIKVEANATNDQKSYQMAFGNNLDNISTLKIIHELKGHLSANYQTGEETYTCGNREIACAGLFVGSDQKTYRFNQVKVGNNTLNGSVFIPGVFE